MAEAQAMIGMFELDMNVNDLAERVINNINDNKYCVNSHGPKTAKIIKR